MYSRATQENKQSGGHMKSMRFHLLLVLSAVSATGCDLFTGLTGCASDDDCATAEVCDDAGVCQPERVRRGRDDDDDDDTGEGEGEEGEGEGEGETTDSLASLIEVAVETVTVPATCAGTSAEAVALITSTSTSPVTIAVAPPAGVSAEPSSITVGVGETVEVRLSLPVPLVLGPFAEQVTLTSAGVSPLDVIVDIEVVATAVVAGRDVPVQNDVLLVVENAGSMQANATSTIQSQFVAFTAALFDVPGTRVSVINADGIDAGRVRRGCTNETLLSTARDVECAIDSLWTSFDGSGDEQALVAMTTWADTTDVLRPDAQLTIVSFGDSTDSSTVSTSAVASQLQALAPEQTQRVAMFSLFDDDEDCFTTTNATNHRLAAVTTALGGTFGSMCSTTDRAAVFEAALETTRATTIGAPGLPDTGEVVVCVVGDGGPCVIVPGAARRTSSGVALDVEDGAEVQVMTAEACPL